MGLEDIPLIGDVAGVAIHGAEAIGDAVTGDWDGAADQAQSMAGSALGVATGGISTAVEDVYDAAAPAFGLPDSHAIGHDVLQGVGNALGDGAYDLMHGGEDGGQGDATSAFGGGLDSGGLGAISDIVDGGALGGGGGSGFASEYGTEGEGPVDGSGYDQLPPDAEY